MDLYDANNPVLLKLKDEAEQCRVKCREVGSNKHKTQSGLFSIEKNLRKEKEALKTYKEEYERFKKLKNKTHNNIKKLEKSLPETKEAYAQIVCKEKELYNELADAEKKLKNELTKELLNMVYLLNPDNSLSFYLLENTKTTPIMDKFNKSDKDFLVLKGFAEHVATTQYNFSYVITKKHDVNHYENKPTMTELKKREWVARMSDIKKCLSDIFQNNKNYTPDQKIPFNKPCLLGGQTYANQTGFGNEYRYGVLEYEGTKYGEVTDFLIVGIVIDDIYKICYL